MHTPKDSRNRLEDTTWYTRLVTGIDACYETADIQRKSLS